MVNTVLHILLIVTVVDVVQRCNQGTNYSEPIMNFTNMLLEEVDVFTLKLGEVKILMRNV